MAAGVEDWLATMVAGAARPCVRAPETDIVGSFITTSRRLPVASTTTRLRSISTSCHPAIVSPTRSDTYAGSSGEFIRGHTFVSKQQGADQSKRRGNGPARVHRLGCGGGTQNRDIVAVRAEWIQR